MEFEVLDSGWYSINGTHDPENENYIAGNPSCSLNCRNYRNFFVFDVSGIDDYISSAVFYLYTGAITEPGTFTLYDVSTPIPILLEGGSGLFTILDDLGSGEVFGNVDLKVGDSRKVIEIDLNPNAFLAIRSAGGLFAIGGSYSKTGWQEYAFGGSQVGAEQNLNKLIVQVPSPITGSLVLLGLIGLYCSRRRVTDAK